MERCQCCLLVVAILLSGCSDGCATIRHRPRASQLRKEQFNEELDRQRSFIRSIKKRPADLIKRRYKEQSWKTHVGLHAVAQCRTTRRVGTLGDGGKWICNGYELSRRGRANRCVVYSVGAGSDISFDFAMASKPYGCEVHLFDPGPDVQDRFTGLKGKGMRYHGGSLRLHSWALGPVSSEPGKGRLLVLGGTRVEVKTLDEIVSALGHRRVDVLKIDIEGGEWSVMADLFSKSLLKRLEVQILLLELHVAGGRSIIDLVDLVGELDRRGFYVYRKEINPLAPRCCAEYAFARRAYIFD